MKKQKVVMSNLVCPECGNVFRIPRKNSKRREEGHVKHMYCPKCKKVTGHIEDNRSEQEKFWDRMQEELSEKYNYQEKK